MKRTSALACLHIYASKRPTTSFSLV